MLGLKLNHVSKRGHISSQCLPFYWPWRLCKQSITMYSMKKQLRAVVGTVFNISSNKTRLRYATVTSVSVSITLFLLRSDEHPDPTPNPYPDTHTHICFAPGETFCVPSTTEVGIWRRSIYLRYAKLYSSQTVCLKTDDQSNVDDKLSGPQRSKRPLARNACTYVCCGIRSLAVVL